METIINSRPDRQITKQVISHGDYNLVPYEDAKCKVIISDVCCMNDAGECQIEAESRVFDPSFDGHIVIGDSDHFIDKDFELILQQMCNGEMCKCKIVYKDSDGNLVKEITCKIVLVETSQEDLISDWDWMRLFSVSTHHKNRGVDLIKEKRIVDAFRKFSKAFKLLVAVEPIDPEIIPEDKVREMIELKVIF